MDRILALVEISELMSGIGFDVKRIREGNGGKSSAMGLWGIVRMEAVGSIACTIAVGGEVSAEGEEVDRTEHWKTSLERC
jgi:hypothetical protein